MKKVLIYLAVAVVFLIVINFIVFRIYINKVNEDRLIEFQRIVKHIKND